jgi:hypothetical protein
MPIVNVVLMYGTHAVIDAARSATQNGEKKHDYHQNFRNAFHHFLLLLSIRERRQTACQDEIKRGSLSLKEKKVEFFNSDRRNGGEISVICD